MDAAAGEDAEPDREREPLADHREDDPGEHARDVLGGQDDPAARREDERRPDRPEPVLARDDEDPGEGGEDGGEAADTEEVPLVLRAVSEPVCDRNPVSSTNSSTSTTRPTTSPIVVRVERIFRNSERV